MSTTSIKLADEVKLRVAQAAERAGISAHAFMVEAISAAADAAEQRAQFVAQAVAARKQLLKAGKGFAAYEVHAHLRARAAGQATKPPVAKPWRS